MANLKYSSDILDYILFRAGEKSDGTSDFDAQSLIYLNAAYKKIWQGGGEFDPAINEDWVWLRKSGNIILQSKISTGTVSVTNNSASATLSASQATDVAGWFFKIDGHEAVFKISVHGGGTDALTLDSVYTGDTNTTASYKLVKLDYTLANDAIEILSPMETYFKANRSFVYDGQIAGVSLQSVPYRNELLSGVPEYFSQIDATTVRFNRYADSDLIRIDYRYKKLPADLTDSGSEEPLVPLHHRHVLANIALYDLWTDKNDDRADSVSLVAKQGLKAMAVENQNRLSQMDHTYGKIHSRVDYCNSPYGSRYVGEPYS
jgi:hypothetical protein